MTHLTLHQARLINRANITLALEIYRDWRGFIFGTQELAQFVTLTLASASATTLDHINNDLEALAISDAMFAAYPDF